MVDLNNIAAFVAVVEAGSFTGGARALQMPKGSISRKISRLEEELNIRLLHRTTRRVTLTDAGRTYYEQCRRGLAELDQAGQALDRARAEPGGTLRISVPSDFGPGRFSNVIDAYLAKYDQVSIELVLTDHFLDLVEHRIDLAIRIGALSDSSLVARKLGAARAVLCAAPAYLDRHGVPDTLQDLRHRDCIVHGRTAEDAVWRLIGPAGAESVRMKCRVSGCNMLHALELVTAGWGIGLLPAAVVQGPLNAGKIVRVLEHYTSPEFGIYAVYPSTRQTSPAVRAFIDLMAERTAGLRK